MYRLGNGQAPLVGAWNEIIGWQNSGQPTNLQHGAYGGNNARQFHNNFGGFGTPAWAPRYGGHWGFGPSMAEMQVAPAFVPQYAPQVAFGPPGPAAFAPQGWPYEIPPRNLLVNQPGPTRADRVILPMSSGVNILPNTSAQITSRPQNHAFRAERCIIAGAQDWVVNDIKVGNVSQFSQSGDIPGEMFGAQTIDAFVKFTTCQTAMDFVIVTTFVGASESGAPFVCGVLGTAAN